MQADRRHNRSSYTSIALGRWLEAVAARNGLSGLVLGDDSGLLVAHGAMDVDRAEAVAAIAPIVPIWSHANDEEMQLLKFEHEGAPLLLAGLGKRPDGKALADAQIGIARILSERIAA